MKMNQRFQESSQASKLKTSNNKWLWTRETYLTTQAFHNKSSIRSQFCNLLLNSSQTSMALRALSALRPRWIKTTTSLFHQTTLNPRRTSLPSTITRNKLSTNHSLFLSRTSIFSLALNNLSTYKAVLAATTTISILIIILTVTSRARMSSLLINRINLDTCPSLILKEILSKLHASARSFRQRSALIPSQIKMKFKSISVKTS